MFSWLTNFTKRPMEDNTMSKATEVTEVTEQSTVGLRETLFQELDELRAGRSNPQRASAAAKLAVQIINSAKMEIEFQRYVTANGGTEPVGCAPVSLGRPE